MYLGENMQLDPNEHMARVLSLIDREIEVQERSSAGNTHYVQVELRLMRLVDVLYDVLDEALGGGGLESSAPDRRDIEYDLAQIHRNMD